MTAQRQDPAYRPAVGRAPQPRGPSYSMGRLASATMRFALLLGHQLPRPWGPGAEAQVLADSLDLVAHADRLGLDRAWVLEHHFLEEFSHASAPAVFLGAASQRSTRIRLGLAATPLPPGFGPAARIAESVATLDLLSGGRVDLGTAEGATAKCRGP